VNNEIIMLDDLTPLLSLRGIAVVGALPKAGAETNVIANLKSLGYEGGIYPVNPNYDDIHSLPCYASLEDIPADAPLDAMAIVMDFKQLTGVLAQVAARGVKSAWVFASGFAEVGEDGNERQAGLNALCQKNGIHFCGPNCVGVVNLHSKTALFSAPLPPGLQAGNVGIIAQSGSASACWCWSGLALFLATSSN
jgi:acyl-CoA synthetase (NDP forming)